MSIVAILVMTATSLIGQSSNSTLAQSSSTQAKPVDQPQLQSRNQRYRLERGDVFDLNFVLTPEFNQTLTVQPDGYVSLRGAGDVEVLGQTLPQASETIRAAYTKLLDNPNVSIVLKDFEKPYFIAGGWVGKPGRYELRGDTTLSQAIQVAGGLKDGAKSSQVILFRTISNDWVEVKRLNIKQILAGKDVREDVHLMPGDMFVVPKSTFARIAPFIPRASLGTYINPTTLN
jgi:polysaccharide export outer membrane protein